MKKLLISLSLIVVVFYSSAIEIVNGDNIRQSIGLSNIKIPRPHAFEVDDPVAMYVVSTQVMEITGEAVLAPGFEVEQGAEFSVSLSDY